MKIYNSILELTGNTPLVRLSKIEKKYSLQGITLLAKLEMFNPSGSVKIRPAKNMILSALRDDIINPKTIIIEPTSGNMGISLAMTCAILDMKFIAVMPSNMSIERRQIIKSYGGEIILTDPKLGMHGAVSKAIQLKEELNGFIPSQFDNKDNPNAHAKTAMEIYNDTLGMVDIIVAGVGTGGTISGIGNNLKPLKDIKIVAVEPSLSPMISENISGPHKILGIGPNFIPQNLDLDIIDKVVTVRDDDAIYTSKLLCQKEGIFVGISSGAALSGAINYIKENDIKNKVVVVIFPDTGERYLSIGDYSE